MFTSVLSADIEGISAVKVYVEADVSGGLPEFRMVGLLSSEVREAKDRVIRAITNSGLELPSRKITINISPANIRKKGTGFDLPIAVAVLGGLGIIDPDKLHDKMITGELSLDGTINKINGILPMALLARDEKIDTLIIPRENSFEGQAVSGVKICGVSNLKELVDAVNKDKMEYIESIDLGKLIINAFEKSDMDYSDVRGQEKAKRATMIAVAGFHNLLYIGPPGSGKSMMASRIPSIINMMSVEECLEVSKIYSVIGQLKDNMLILNRPFRDPHHSITGPALIGGMSPPKPGEITLAHKGVLFLDEIAEFKKNTIEQLRQPLENKNIVISRARERIEYPADFMLVLAMNPCKCGYYPDKNLCKCAQSDVDRYLGKVRGPILDRVDICVGTSKLDLNDLSFKTETISSGEMREIVLKAQDIQKARFKNNDINFNSQMRKKEFEKFCRLDDKGQRILKKAFDKFNMTARGYYKVLKVSRTIADIEGEENILEKHILEAIGYRNDLI